MQLCSPVGQVQHIGGVSIILQTYVGLLDGPQTGARGGDVGEMAGVQCEGMWRTGQMYDRLVDWPRNGNWWKKATTTGVEDLAKGGHRWHMRVRT